MPPEIANIKGLHFLGFSNNRVAGSLPAAALGALTSLSILVASSNALTGAAPLELLRLPNITVVHLNDNLLDALPTPDWAASVLPPPEVLASARVNDQIAWAERECC